MRGALFFDLKYTKITKLKAVSFAEFDNHLVKKLLNNLLHSHAVSYRWSLRSGQSEIFLVIVFMMCSLCLSAGQYWPAMNQMIVCTPKCDIQPVLMRQSVLCRAYALV